MELYEQLLPTRIYAAYKTGASDQISTMRRMCGEVTESFAQILVGFSLLAQTKYMESHNATPKCCSLKC